MPLHFRRSPYDILMTRTRVPTGSPVIDERLNGGIPTGSILSLNAPPDSQAELLLYTLADTQSLETVYITSERSRDAIRDGYERSPISSPTPKIVSVDGESPLDSASDYIKTIPEESIVVIDIINVLENTGGTRYRRFLNQVQNHMINTNSVALLYGLDGESRSENRDITLNMSDIVFTLRTRIDGGDVINELSIPKFRGGTPLDETLTLELTDTVAIDTSRDIA